MFLREKAACQECISDYYGHCQKLLNFIRANQWEITGSHCVNNLVLSLSQLHTHSPKSKHTQKTFWPELNILTELNSTVWTKRKTHPHSLYSIMAMVPHLVIQLWLRVVDILKITSSIQSKSKPLKTGTGNASSSTEQLVKLSGFPQI